MKRKVIDLYDYIGVSTKYIGYKYLVDETVILADLTKKNKHCLVRSLFDNVANKYNTNILSVEKDTRTCIEGLFNKGNKNHIDDVFKGVQSYYDDRPSNKLFLTTIVNCLINKE